MSPNMPLVPTRNGKAPLHAAQRRRWATQGEHLANWLMPLDPDGGRLVAYLERRTPWDS